MAKNVKDLMTSNPCSIDSDKSTAYAAKMMRDENVGLAPIVEGDRLIGTVTDRDITIRLSPPSMRHTLPAPVPAPSPSPTPAVPTPAAPLPAPTPGGASARSAPATARSRSANS